MDMGGASNVINDDGVSSENADVENVLEGDGSNTTGVVDTSKAQLDTEQTGGEAVEQRPGRKKHTFVGVHDESFRGYRGPHGKEDSYFHKLMLDPHPKQPPNLLAGEGTSHEKEFTTPNGVIVTIFQPPHRLLEGDLRRIGIGVLEASNNGDVKLDNSTRCFCRMRTQVKCVCHREETAQDVKERVEEATKRIAEEKVKARAALEQIDEAERVDKAKNATLSMESMKEMLVAKRQNRTGILAQRLKQHESAAEGLRAARLPDEINTLQKRIEERIKERKREEKKKKEAEETRKLNGPSDEEAAKAAKAEEGEEKRKAMGREILFKQAEVTRLYESLKGMRVESDLRAEEYEKLEINTKRTNAQNRVIEEEEIKKYQKDLGLESMNEINRLRSRVNGTIDDKNKDAANRVRIMEEDIKKKKEELQKLKDEGLAAYLRKDAEWRHWKALLDSLMAQMKQAEAAYKSEQARRARLLAGMQEEDAKRMKADEERRKKLLGPCGPTPGWLKTADNQTREIQHCIGPVRGTPVFDFIASTFTEGSVAVGCARLGKNIDYESVLSRMRWRTEHAPKGSMAEYFGTPDGRGQAVQPATSMPSMLEELESVVSGVHAKLQVRTKHLLTHKTFSSSSNGHKEAVQTQSRDTAKAVMRQLRGRSAARKSKAHKAKVASTPEDKDGKNIDLETKLKDTTSEAEQEYRRVAKAKASSDADKADADARAKAANPDGEDDKDGVKDDPKGTKKFLQERKKQHATVTDEAFRNNSVLVNAARTAVECLCANPTQNVTLAEIMALGESDCSKNKEVKTHVVVGTDRSLEVEGRHLEQEWRRVARKRIKSLKHELSRLRKGKYVGNATAGVNVQDEFKKLE
jgi:hypothetical protein